MKRNFSSFILSILFSVTCFYSFAQDRKPIRLEIPVKDDTEIYKVVPCSNNGLMIIYLSSDSDEAGNMLWITAMLDVNLKEIWRKSYPLPKGFVLEDALYANNHLIAFFHFVRGGDENNFRILDVMINEASLVEARYTIPERSGLSHFSISKNFALAGLNNKNNESLLLRYDFNRKDIVSINPGIDGKVIIESLNIDKETGLTTLILRTTGSSAKKRSYFLVKLNSNGGKVSDLALSKFDDNNMINTAFAYSIDANTELVIGSYGRTNRTRVIDGYESIGVASTGFFSVLIKDNKEVNSGFYDFTNFQNFYRYLRRPSDLSIRRGSNRAERTNSVSVDHDLLTHEIFQWKNDYVFVAEAYYPEYRTVTTMVYDYYGRPYPSTYSVFEGYRYLTTFIAGFDSTGAIRWNNDLELRNILSQNLKPRVIAWEDSDGLVLSYTNDGKIASKLIDGGTSIDNISYTDIATLSPRDRVYSDSNSSLEFWYNNYFLVYGYQNLRNSYQNDRNNKNIFYINKIAFR